MNKITLSEISKKYPTDKDFTHNYYNAVYEKFLSPIRYNVRSVCEIGIGGFYKEMNWVPGNSLKVWRDYFPNAQILGLDIVRHDDIQDLDRITLDQIDQSKKDQIIQYSNRMKDYDLIVDDGSHNVYHQQITLAYLLNSLHSGGIYILEDLHSSIEVEMPEKAQLWGWGEPGFITPLEFLENYQKHGNIDVNSNKPWQITNEEINLIKESIASVEVFHVAPTSITAVICKK
jgi:hypothetical protein